jgi:isopenicillin-N epimerase
MKDEQQLPRPSQFAEHWMLDPGVVFLNHGSFGACPRGVLQVQQHWRDRMERQPLQFFGIDLEGLLNSARIDLAAFVGADPEDLVFVPNATTGVNAVLRSLRFQPGDQLLTTNHEYNACRNALNYVAEREGVQVVVAEIPFPVDSPGQILAAILQKVSSQTRLVLVDHVTSQTGLIFPLAELAQELGQRGIEILVDGAHAPGMLPLNLQELGATYYSGNLHKWTSAPKGAAFLYVERDRQPAIRPLTISHGANSPRTDQSRFHLEFDWMGTDDPTAYLSVPAAIADLGKLLPGGWQALREHNHQLAVAARELLCNALEIAPPCPAEMLGALAVVPLPDGDYRTLQTALLETYRIEVPIIPWAHPTGRQLRISAQLYNALDQYQYLADALVELLY